MKNWKDTEISIGEFKEKSIIKVTFEGEDELKEVQRIEPGCKSCTDYTYDAVNKKLKVVIKTGHLPLRLRIAGKSQPFRKIVTVYYMDGSKDVLQITGYKYR